MKRYSQTKIAIWSIVLAFTNGCSSALELHLWSNKERTQYIVDGKDHGIIQRMTVSLEHGRDLSHTIIARRDGYCEKKDQIHPPYFKATVLEFLFREDDECIPCPPPCQLDFGNYYALVIGNNEYQHKGIPTLQTAVNDAEVIAGLLESNYGFTVNLMLNARFADIKGAFEAYRNGSKYASQPKLTENDSLLVYYAGHGQVFSQIRGNPQGYWLPVDAEPDNMSKWISNHFIADHINVKNLRANHVLIIADSCYSGLLTRAIGGADFRGLDHYEKNTKDYFDRIWRLFSKPSRTALTAGGNEPVIDFDGDGLVNHSVFAKAFLDVLQNNKGIMDATNLFVKIRSKVIPKADQTPEFGNIHKTGHDGGDFLFVKR